MCLVTGLQIISEHHEQKNEVGAQVESKSVFRSGHLFW